VQIKVIVINIGKIMSGVQWPRNSTSPVPITIKNVRFFSHLCDVSSRPIDLVTGEDVEGIRRILVVALVLEYSAKGAMPKFMVYLFITYVP